jgi:hypothetical protein
MQQMQAGSNPMQMIAQFRQFAKSMTPQKAQQQIEKMLTSGQMSQTQFESLKQQAQSFMQLLK